MSNSSPSWLTFGFESLDDSIQNIAQSLRPLESKQRSDSSDSSDGRRDSDAQSSHQVPQISVSQPETRNKASNKSMSQITDAEAESSTQRLPSGFRSRARSWASDDDEMLRTLELSRQTAEAEEAQRQWYRGYYSSRPSSREPSPQRPPPYSVSSSDAIDLDTLSPFSGSSHKRRSAIALGPDGTSTGSSRSVNTTTPGQSQPVNTTQRSRSSTLQASPSPNNQEQQQRKCDGCSTRDHNHSYCNVCECFFCTQCWNKQAAHKPGRDLEIPHERTLWSVASLTQEVFAPKLSNEDRKRLHYKDMITSWFGVVREDRNRPLLRDYGRFEFLMSSILEPFLATISHTHMTGSPNDVRFPSFVSFVGTTGAGKSSLIKLIIDLNSDVGQTCQTPVVGEMGSSSPTSTDVHLYLDPCTAHSDHPILYADCEGLEGGEREPVGAAFKREWETRTRQPARPDLESDEYMPHHVSERELLWTKESNMRSREFAVAQLYPRLLYTFSDVIVFVLKNPKVMESVLVKLVEWAAAAFENTSNQPSVPHAVIVLNASENGLAPEMWDVTTATANLMQEMSRTVHLNATFRRYAKFWRDLGRAIDTVEDLLLSFYSSVKVVRIPTVGRPNLIGAQIQKLTGQIRDACQSSGERKAGCRMLLNAEATQTHLQYAFEHFSRSLDWPFDFVQASFSNSPIPADFGGNILKLAIQLMDRWENKAGADAIFDELAVMVASCIMLESTREKLLGNAQAILPSYLEHLDNALENFCDRHWPCEYVRQGKGRCVNVRSGHTKGHQSKDGKILADGDYWSTFSFETFRDHFANEVYAFLDELICNLLSQNKVRVGRPENRAATELHKTKVLQPFFTHATQGFSGNVFSSHTVCFCCLFDFPEHALSCGHVLCTKCLKSYGSIVDENLVDVWDCPIGGRLCSSAGPLRFRLKPEHCGIRILSLDGGGIRGIAELEILLQIEKALGSNLQIHDFFDLVVGTSTGGIIALGFAASGWSVEDCATKFEDLCKRAFRPRRLANQPVLGLIIQSFHHSLYETRPFVAAVIDAFTVDKPLFGHPLKDSGNPPVKVAITTAAAGSSVVLANYNRAPEPSLPYHFERPEKASSEFRVWEAARATSAAPLYFTPFTHPRSKQTYIDGGVYHNNPINIAERERKLIWPCLAGSEADVIVSLGTSHNLDTYVTGRPRKMASKGIISQVSFLTNMAKDHINMSMDSEQTWKDFRAAKPQPDRFRYCRLNTGLMYDPPRLDDLSAMNDLRKETRKQFQGCEQITKLARHLIATSFYFESDATDSSNRIEVSGHIRCRIPNNDPRLAEIAKFIYATAGVGNTAYFLLTDHESMTGPRLIFELEQALEQMVHNHKFQMPEIRFQARSKAAKTMILLCYGTADRFPISGFPKRLCTDPLVSKGTRRALTTTDSTRWAGRTQSQRQRQWKPRQRKTTSPTGELLSRFTDASHVLGNATSRDMELQSQRLMSGIDQNAHYHTGELEDTSMFSELHELDAAPVIAELDGNEIGRNSAESPE